VTAAENYYTSEKILDGITSIEQVSHAYGNQAVVVSVDLKRVYMEGPSSTPHHTIKMKYPNNEGFGYCWYQCYIKGGLEARDLDVYQLMTAVEAMGCGEILLNCIDKDGTGSGFDTIGQVKEYLQEEGLLV